MSGRWMTGKQLHSNMTNRKKTPQMAELSERQPHRKATSKEGGRKDEPSLIGRQ